MSALRPIETVYNGYHFRSRLEARWAVLFDTAGVAWEYEKEGFRFGRESYLPDFWLPKPQVWVEVKGQEPNERERRVAQLLANGSERPVAVVNGQWNDWYGGDYPLSVGQLFWPHGVVGRKGPAHERASLFHCEHCDNFAIQSLHDDDWHCYECGEFWVPLCTELLRQAIDAARAARFEHGDRAGRLEHIATVVPRAIARDARLCIRCQASFPTGRRLCDECRAIINGTVTDWLDDSAPDSDQPHHAPHR